MAGAAVTGYRSAGAVNPVTVNSFAGEIGALRPAVRDLVRRRMDVLAPAYRLMYAEPLDVSRAAGAYLFDRDGRRYLDLYNNVPGIGHSHPKVAEAVATALTEANPHTRYLSEAVVDYAERLLETFAVEARPPDRVQFCCTGTEANDLAVRIARAAAGRVGVIVTQHAYHGSGGLAVEASPSVAPGEDWVFAVPAPLDGDPAAFAASVSAAAAELDARGFGCAALLLDSAFTSDGVVTDPIGLLGPAYAAARAAGGLVIADEVQPGFGRLGDGWWGHARHGVVPDLITLGKPMGNGLPIAAVVSRSEIFAAYEPAYFNTFAGTPVTVAAARTVLDVIIADGLIEHARSVGARLLGGLQGLFGPAAVRGAGLYAAVDIHDPAGRPDPAATAGLIAALRRRQILVSATGPGGSTLKIRPPLVVTEADIDHFLEVLDDELPRLVG
ncbi:4-aminobutyrate aminotransferase-like enzyme [Naumannella cuiyingiana]|uniref:4-aminobutyrate aminotransferase-like enzyme n=1 Tax=Naumannella cuiyingiana TaxID=1347891 RepID=A0A7Z0D8X1_9ACTN|nr:4-aminobutyrate aminotransferase-like enzyme [Naumannella cuiyingiana]